MCAGLVACAGMLPAVAGAQTAKKAAAVQQFEKAEKARTALGGKAARERSLVEYRRLIESYRRVYLITPHAVEAPAALLAVAELYHDMGREFDSRYHQESIDAYLFLLKHYPTSRYRHDALFTVAQIQHEDLAQLDAAEATYQEFLKRFPRAPQAAQAREALQAMARQREEAPKAPQQKAAAQQPASQEKLPQVTNLRHWNGENFTRIVIDVESEVKWESARIAKPDRIYFDIYKAKLGSPLSGKTFELEGGFLKSIRVAQNQLGVVRVVLDVEKVKDFSVFLLPNPHRLVVDVYGETVTAAKAAPESKPLLAPEKAEKAAPGKAKEPVEVAKNESAKAAPAPEKAAGKARETEKEKKERETSEALREPAAAQPTREGELSQTRALGLKIRRVVIDAGHGGHDTGTIGPSGLMEKDLCLDVALRLGKLLKERIPGIEIVQTREDDTFIPLENRTAIANQAKGDLFISVHANSSRDKSARGVETYYLNFAADSDALEVAARENALSQSSVSDLQDVLRKIARNEKVEESRELAREVQESLAARLRRVSKANKDRGVKKAPFVVLIGANMPSVLAEISFLSNPADEFMLKKGDHRGRVAEGLFAGLRRYMESLGSTARNVPPAVHASQ
jgi:N-acetylmuramoyl-L-alanine amidase